jgi:hypothetical protein
LFNLFADQKRQADIREILLTAKTLGYDKKEEFLYSILSGLAN